MHHGVVGETGSKAWIQQRANHPRPIESRGRGVDKVPIGPACGDIGAVDPTVYGDARRAGPAQRNGDHRSRRPVSGMVGTANRAKPRGGVDPATDGPADGH